MNERTKKLLTICVAGGVLVGLYFAFDWAMGAVVHDRPVVIVPQLTGKSLTDAVNLLAQSHLGMIKEGEQYDKSSPPGTVVRQNPASGMTVREGRMIRITISQGGETVFVPTLVGQPLRNAQTELQNAGLGVGQVERHPSLRFEKDQVMTVDPASGSTVAKNTLINLVLSDGPPASDVLLTPDFVGKMIDDAKTWGDSHHVAVTVREATDATKNPGEVLLQNPSSDTPMKPGDTLDLVMNGEAGSQSGPHVHYEVPQGGGDRDIRILVIDESGEREVFRKAQSPGSKIDFPVTVKGRARARVLVNGIMVEEQELQ